MTAWEEIERALTAIAFVEIVANESHRLLVVPPEHLDRARWHVEQNGVDRYVRVEASPYLPDGSVFLIDEQALDAGHRESTQHAARDLHLWPPGQMSPMGAYLWAQKFVTPPEFPRFISGV